MFLRRSSLIASALFLTLAACGSDKAADSESDPSSSDSGADDETGTTDPGDDSSTDTTADGGDGDGNDDGDDGGPVDLCPDTPELDLEDADLDGLGDACDNCPAPRESYLPEGSSNLPFARYWVRNFPWQQDSDLDGVGDLCDVCVTVSDCVDDALTCQADADSDLVGDACVGYESEGSADPVGWETHEDFDQDGLRNQMDLCPRQAVVQMSCTTDADCPPQATCTDLKCNHTDTDNDGVGNICDTCPFAANPDQSTEQGMGLDDIDGDGVGSACESAPACASVPDPRPIAFYEVAVDGYCCVTTAPTQGQYIDLGDGTWGCKGHCDPNGLPITRTCANEPESQDAATPDGQLCRRLPDHVQAPNAYGITDLPPNCADRLLDADRCDPGDPDCDPTMANRQLTTEDLAPGESLYQHLCVLPQLDRDFDGYGDACDDQPLAFNPQQAEG